MTETQTLYQRIHTVEGPFVVNHDHIKEAARKLSDYLFGGRHDIGNIAIGKGILYVYLRDERYTKNDIPTDWETYPVEVEVTGPIVPL